MLLIDPPFDEYGALSQRVLELFRKTCTAAQLFEQASVFNKYPTEKWSAGSGAIPNPSVYIKTSLIGSMAELRGQYVPVAFPRDTEAGKQRHKGMQKNEEK